MAALQARLLLNQNEDDIAAEAPKIGRAVCGLPLWFLTLEEQEIAGQHLNPAEGPKEERFRKFCLHITGDAGRWRSRRKRPVFHGDLWPMNKRELIRNDRKYCRSSQTPVPAKRAFWIQLSLSARGLSDNPRTVMGNAVACFGGLRQQRRPPRRTRREATASHGHSRSVSNGTQLFKLQIFAACRLRYMSGAILSTDGNGEDMVSLF